MGDDDGVVVVADADESDCLCSKVDAVVAVVVAAAAAAVDPDYVGGDYGYG